MVCSINGEKCFKGEKKACSSVITKIRVKEEKYSIMHSKKGDRCHISFFGQLLIVQKLCKVNIKLYA